VLQQFAGGAQKKRAKKQKEISQALNNKLRDQSKPNEDLNAVLGNDIEQSMTVLGMRHKSVYFDREDPATMSMYGRKINMRDFQSWLRSQTKIKTSSQIEKLLLLKNGN